MQDQKKGQSTGSTGATTGTAEEETAKTGKQGQHWRGEPWAKNPEVGGKETTETGSETSGQHWRGEELPPARSERKREQTPGRERETTPAGSDRPDEC